VFTANPRDCSTIWISTWASSRHCISKRQVKHTEQGDACMTLKVGNATSSLAERYAPLLQKLLPYF
jgi:hypothetical protein